MGALCALAVFVGTIGGSFHDDDVQLIGLGQDHGFSITMLFGEPRFLEHLVPLSNTLSWVIGVLGAHWWLAHWYAALATLLLVVLIAFLVRRLTDSPAAALLTAGAVGTSIVVFTVATWWASTALQLSMLSAGVVMLIFAVRWDEARSRVAFGGAIAAQFLACGFYDRAQLLPVAAWVVLAVARPSSEEISARLVWQRTKESGALLAGLFAVVITQFVLTLVLASQNSGALTAAGRTSLTGWLQMLADWWVVGVGAVASNGYSGSRHSASEAFTHPSWLAGIAVLAVLAGATIRNRRAALIWAGAIVLITLSAFQVAAGRLAQLGSLGLASAFRYQELTLLFLAVLVPAAWAASGRPRPHSRRATGLLAVLILLGAAAWLLSYRTTARDRAQVSYRGATYAHNLESSLRRFDSTGRKLTLLDVRVPETVVIAVPQVEQYALTSKVARVFAPGTPVPPVNQPDGAPILVDGEGVFQEVKLGPAVGFGLTGQGCGSAPVGAGWLEPGAAVFAGEIPPIVIKPGRRIALTVRLRQSNARGQLGITSSVMKFPALLADLADYPDGIRAIVPAGTATITFQLWNGAEACVQGASAAAILSP